jgi:hypothetical protein
VALPTDLFCEGRRRGARSAESGPRRKRGRKEGRWVEGTSNRLQEEREHGNE